MIELSKDGPLWVVTLNRPQKANSLTRKMLIELAEIVERSDAKALILMGAGKVFSAGADLEAAKAGLAVDPIWERLSEGLAAFPGLSIAALNGTLAGGAFGMVLACDIRIAVPEAKFFYPVMKLGFLPQPSDPVRMAKLIGPARTKMILMAGQKISAEDALTWGLIDQVSQRDELIDLAKDLAADALAADAKHVSDIKQLIRT